jgi:tetratricopeptide (TPR) repeat protein
LTNRLNELDPNFVFGSGVLPYTYFRLKRYDEALAGYLKAQEMTHVPSAGLAVTYSKLGRQEDARHVLNQMLEEARTRYVRATSIALIYAELGEKDETFHWLERAYSEHDANLVNLLLFEEFQALRADPRFIDLARRIHLDPSTAPKDDDKP